MKTMLITDSFQPVKWNFFCSRPKMTANTMNMMETMPAAPLVLRGIRQAGHTIGGDVSVEGTGDHVSKSSDNDAAEQPAEQQEQLTAGLADVLLDQQAHGLTVILDGSIQGAEVGNSAEEDAADEHPQQDGQPAESGSLDSTGNRAGTCDGRELMAENGPAIGGHVVLAILQPHSRKFWRWGQHPRF